MAPASCGRTPPAWPFSGATSAAIGSRRFARGEPAADQIARIAATLSPGAAPRLERLRGFGAGIGRALTCACSHIVLADNTAAILVAAIERAGPDLPLGERVARLLAGGQEPIAAFTVGGQLMAATEGAHAHLRGATSLAAIGAGALVAQRPGERTRRGRRWQPNLPRPHRQRGRDCADRAIRAGRRINATAELRQPARRWHRRHPQRRPNAAIRFASSGR